MLALKNYKRNFWKYLLVDSVFLSFVFFLMVYAKGKVETFFILFEGYQVQLEAIEPELLNQTVTGLLQFEQIADQLNALVTNTYIFIVFLVPLLIFLVFCLSQSYNFSLGMNKKYNWKRLVRFLLLGISFVVILFFLFSLFFDNFAYFLYSWNYLLITLLLGLLIVVVFYVWFYLFVNKIRLRSFKEMFFALKKVGLSYLGMILFGLLSLSILGVLYVRLITDSFYQFMWIPMILFLLLFLAIMGYFRVVFVKKLLS